MSIRCMAHFHVAAGSARRRNAIAPVANQSSTQPEMAPFLTHEGLGEHDRLSPISIRAPLSCIERRVAIRRARRHSHVQRS